jgi:VanZ family protein
MVGALDEWHQRYLPGRSAELLDLAADALAAGIMLMVFLTIRDKEVGEITRNFKKNHIALLTYGHGLYTK